MKILILSVLVLSSCSFQKNNDAPAFQTQKNDAVSPEPGDSHAAITKVAWEPGFFKTINEREKIANLKTLRTAVLPEHDIELRVWNGFGLGVLEGFVMKRSGAEWSATYLMGVYQPSSGREYQKILAPPKSGWETCWQRLEEAGILTLPDGVAIQCSIPVPDEISCVLEFKTDGIYRTCSYEDPINAKCDEARPMIKIRNIITEEFALWERAAR